MEIEQLAKKLSKSELVCLLANIYGIHEDIDAIIDRRLLHNKSVTKAGEEENIFLKQIRAISQEDDFISYDECPDFAFRLSELLTDIDFLLTDQDAKLALKATERFIGLTDSVMERADDSNGEIGDIFREAIAQWLDIAANLRKVAPDAEQWVEKVLHFFNGNDYGCFDQVIADSGNLLTEQELRQLAWRFENDAKQALANKSNDRQYNLTAAHACIGLESVAAALEDITLYEKATLLQSPQPNAMQMASIVEFALHIGDQARAEYWLAQPGWEQRDYQKKQLTNKLLEQQGNVVQIKQNLLDEFHEHPNGHNLQQYLHKADAEERNALAVQVETIAQTSVDLGDAVEMLILIDNPALAASLLHKRYAEIAGYFYGTLVQWAHYFEQNNEVLAAVICYRNLLTDLLDRGYSKAYHHGADYFHKLILLDGVVTNYKGLDSSSLFIKSIQSKHWRKRSFWEQANYPNKPLAT